MAKLDKGDEVRPIIVKRVKKAAAGHHGGAWKVAYADFVTAMMAFFLLLWLLNVSTDEQKEAISAYFDPTHPRISENLSGAGGILGGTSIATQGAMTSELQPISGPQSTGSASKSPRLGQQHDEAQVKKLEEILKKREEARFKKAAEDLRKSLEANEELKKLSEHVKIDVTPEGMAIQIVDQDNKPMFASGSADMYPYMQALLSKVAEVIADMPNDISVRGHTDSYKYAEGKAYTNWELSADRANSTRRILLQNGLNEEKLSDVMGLADTDPLLKDDPYNAQNRRISIILLHETLEDAMERGAFGKQDSGAPEEDTSQQPEESADDVYYENLEEQNEPDQDFTKTPADVEFP